MWLQRLTNYLLNRRAEAIALTFVSTLLSNYLGVLVTNAPVLLGLLGALAAVFLGLFGILIASLITLVKGALEGAFVVLAATIPYLLSIYLPGNATSNSPVLLVWIGVGVAVLSNLLTYVFAVMLRRKTGWSSLIQIAALLGVLAISLVHLAYPGVVDWWGAELQALQPYYAQASSTAAVKSAATAMPSDAQVEAINITKSFATGVIVVAILCNALIQLSIARWWQAGLFNPGALRRELRGIRLSRLAGILFLMSLGLSYFGNAVVLDIMPVLYVLFAVAGLSLIHYLFALLHSKMIWFWLSIFYLTVLVSLPFSIVMIAMLAWFDIWFDIRKRFRKV